MITKIKIKFYLIDLLIKSKFNNNKILTTFQVLSFKNLTHNILMKMMYHSIVNHITKLKYFQIHLFIWTHHIMSQIRVVLPHIRKKDLQNRIIMNCLNIVII